MQIEGSLDYCYMTRRPFILQLGRGPRGQQSNVLIWQTEVLVYEMEPSLQVSVRWDARWRTTACLAEEDIPIASKEGLSLPFVVPHPQPRRSECSLVERRLGGLGERVLGFLRLGPGQYLLTIPGREGIEFGEDLGQYVHLGEVEVGRCPEPLEQVCPRGVVHLAGIVGFDIVETSQWL